MSERLCERCFVIFEIAPKSPHQRFCCQSCANRNRRRHRFTDEQRFAAKIRRNEATGCEEWIGSRTSGGYGQFWIGSRLVVAHVWAWVSAFGPIGAGLVIDHLCRSRCCVNTSHMELVSHQENVRRGSAGLLRPPTQPREMCANGHAYSASNSVQRKDRRRGVWRCRACARERYHRSMARKRTA